MPDKSKSTAFNLCCYLGALGAHRFYLGRWLTGLLMLLTGGGLMIWWIIDMVRIAGGSLRDSDGNDLRSAPRDPNNPYAGFWVRFAAWHLDSLILQLLMMLLISVVMLVLGVGSLQGLDWTNPNPMALRIALQPYAMIVLPIILLIYPLYFAIQTTSSHQATIGKRAFAIYVCSTRDARLNLWRSLWRSFCYLLSLITLGLGYLMAAFTPRKRALHDYLAGSKVLYSTKSPLAVSNTARNLHDTAAFRASDMPTAKPRVDSGSILIAIGGVLLLTVAAALALF